MMDICKLIFHWVLFSSVNAGILALLIIAVRTVSKKRIAPRVLCLLWLLVIVKLITAPIAAQSQISMFHLFNYQQINNNVPGTTINYQPDSAYSDAKATSLNEQLNGTANIPIQASRENDNTHRVQESAKNVRNAESPELASVFALAWAAGMLLMICTFTCSGIVFAKRLRNGEKIPDALLPELIRDYKQKQRCSIDLYTSSAISTPCMTGIIKPKIYVPWQIFEQSDKQQLTHILMHEIAHVKRKDNLLNVLVAAVNAIHWFNPVLWYAMKLFNLDREISCDAYALEILGQEETVPYGLTLLHHSKMIPQNHFQLSVSSYFKSEKQIGRRIIMIKNFKKGSYRITAAALMLCLLFGLATFANAAGINLQAESTTGTAQTANSMNDPIRTALGNSGYMYFNNLEKAQNFTDFTFKVPDYLPAGFELYTIHLKKDKIYKNDLLEICCWSTTDGGKMISNREEHHFTLSVSKGNLLENVKSNENATYEEVKKNINGLDATFVTVHTKQHVDQKNVNFIIMDTVKHLIWQDQDTWYNLEYYVSSKGRNGTTNVYENMSQDDLNKIVSSMRVPQDIKNVDYTSEAYKNFFAIYNEADLKDAEKILGFIPKLPLHITDGFNISLARVENGTYLANDMDTPIITSKYCATGKDNASETIEIEQSKLSSLYDSIAKNGYMSFWNSSTHKDETIIGKAVNIAAVNVFAFDVTFAKEKTYVWEQNGIYYTATLSKNIGNPDAIINTFVTLNP